MCCHGSSIVFHPHCAEWDISIKCPHVSLMTLLSVVQLQVTLGANQPNVLSREQRVAPMLHLFGVLCVPNYSTKTSNTRFTANVSSCTCATIARLKPFSYNCSAPRLYMESTDMEVQLFCEDRMSRLMLISAINIGEG